MASSTSIGVLLLDDFVLAINDKTYQVDKPAINPGTYMLLHWCHYCYGHFSHSSNTASLNPLYSHASRHYRVFCITAQTLTLAVKQQKIYQLPGGRFILLSGKATRMLALPQGVCTSERDKV